MTPGQKVHSSLLRADDGTAERYTPKARPPHGNSPDSFWKTLRDQGIGGQANEWLELDLANHIRKFVDDFIASAQSDASLESVHHLTISSKSAS